MNKKEQAKFGRIGGAKTGTTKRRGDKAYYSGLARLAWATRRANKEAGKNG